MGFKGSVQGTKSVSRFAVISYVLYGSGHLSMLGAGFLSQRCHFGKHLLGDALQLFCDCQTGIAQGHR